MIEAHLKELPVLPDQSVDLLSVSPHLIISSLAMCLLVLEGSTQLTQIIQSIELLLAIKCSGILQVHIIVRAIVYLHT